MDPFEPSDSEEEDSNDEDPELIEDEFGLYDPETGLLGGEITKNLYDGESDSEDDEEEASDADDSARLVFPKSILHRLSCRFSFEELKDTPCVSQDFQ